MPLPLILGVSGCRGVVGESLTPAVASRFAGAFGSWLMDRAGGGLVSVVVGRDGRCGGEEIQRAAMEGLLECGCAVFDAGVAMTPTIAVMTDEAGRFHGVLGDLAARATPGAQTEPGRGCPAGLVITASHNPQQWNGLKCLLAEGGLHGSAACAPPAALAQQIIARFHSPATAQVRARLHVHQIAAGAAVARHVTKVLGAMRESGLTEDPASLGRGLRVAVDSVNASGVAGVAQLAKFLALDHLEHIGADTTGVFPHPPEPTAENLAAPGGLCDVVRERACDVGFAQDPDADRVALIDEQGRYIGEEYTLALSAMAVLEAETKRRRDGETKTEATGDRRQATGEHVLVTNLSTSRMIDDVARRYGARVIRTPVGEANVVEVMKREGALAGGEGNGGIIWPRVTYVRDSLSAMALTLWLMSPAGGGNGRKRRLSELVASIPRYAIEKRKVDLARREDAQPAIARICRAYAAQRIDRSDGAWVDFTGGPLAGKAWLHVRASNTEPIMRLIAEAPTSEAAGALLDEAGGIIA